MSEKIIEEKEKLNKLLKEIYRFDCSFLSELHIKKTKEIIDKLRSELIDFKDRVKKGHIQYKLKCMSCGLHFITLSYYYDWFDKVLKYKGIFCPECGNNDIFVVTAVNVNKQIYEFV